MSSRVDAEEIIEPDLPIVDCHHHLRDDPGGLYYMIPEFLADISSGHKIVATVGVEVGDMSAAEGPIEFRPVNETAFLNGVAAMFASGRYGATKACAGIVGFANLTLGSRVEPVLDAHERASQGRFRGVRVSAFWHESYAPSRITARRTKLGLNTPEHLLLDPAFREGIACLAARGLSYDVSIFYTQVPDLIDLARAFPTLRIIAGHYVVPLGLGPFAGKHRDIFPLWRSAIKKLAECPNVSVKLSGIRWAGVTVPGYTLNEHGAFDGRPTAQELAAAWRPYIETCVEYFGADRCMFGSNFPPERVLASYVRIWNAFKLATSGFSTSERTALFHDTAACSYRLDLCIAQPV